MATKNVKGYEIRAWVKWLRAQGYTGPFFGLKPSFPHVRDLAKELKKVETERARGLRGFPKRDPRTIAVNLARYAKRKENMPVEAREEPLPLQVPPKALARLALSPEKVQEPAGQGEAGAPVEAPLKLIEPSAKEPHPQAHVRSVTSAGTKVSPSQGRKRSWPQGPVEFAYLFARRKALRWLTGRLAELLDEFTPQKLDDLISSDGSLVDGLRNDVPQTLAEWRKGARRWKEYLREMTPWEIATSLEELLPDHAGVVARYPAWLQRELDRLGLLLFPATWGSFPGQNIRIRTRAVRKGGCSKSPEKTDEGPSVL